MTYFFMCIFFTIIIYIYYLLLYKIKYLYNLLNIAESKINNLNNAFIVAINEGKKIKKDSEEICIEFTRFQDYYRKEKKLIMELNNIEYELAYYKKQIDNIKIVSGQVINIIPGQVIK